MSITGTRKGTPSSSFVTVAAVLALAGGNIYPRIAELAENIPRQGRKLSRRSEKCSVKVGYIKCFHMLFINSVKRAVVSEAYESTASGVKMSEGDEQGIAALSLP